MDGDIFLLGDSQPRENRTRMCDSGLPTQGCVWRPPRPPPTISLTQLENSHPQNHSPRETSVSSRHLRLSYYNINFSCRKLRHIKLIINPLLRQQLLCISFFHDMPVVHYKNAVGVLNRGKSVGNDERSPAF